MATDLKSISRMLTEEAWNKGNLNVIDEFIAPEFVNHDPAAPFEVRGAEGYKKFLGAYRLAFPDIMMTIEDQVAEGDKVWQRWTLRGTHKGTLLGVPATGRKVNVTGQQVTRWKNGRAVELWGNWDALGLMEQLGVVGNLTRQIQ